MTVTAPAATSAQEMAVMTKSLSRIPHTNAVPLICSPADASRMLVIPTASPTVVTRKPWSANFVRAESSAATVWSRSPPPSCIRRTWPCGPDGARFRSIAATPGRCQSSLSLVVSTVR